MSNKAAPILFLNLSGEMLYVLDQRLRTQNIQMSKGSRVMSDITLNIFNASLLGEVFKLQPIYGKKDLGSIFKRLVNSSIMKVDPASMEKLYDLMLMTYKYQVVKSSNSMDLVHVTLNHLDCILKLVQNNRDVEKLTENGLKWFVKHCSEMSIGELIHAKQTILSFLHDLKSKVSVLISLGDQNQDGSFIIEKDIDVPEDFDIPGTITYCDEGRTEKFETGAIYRPHKVAGSSTKLGGKRLTHLGLNLYSAEVNPSTFKAEYTSQTTSNADVEAESKLLGHLLGASMPQADSFSLNLFGPDLSEFTPNVTTTTGSKPQEGSGKLVNIKAETVRSKELSDIRKDFSDIGQSPSVTDSDDLLSMMDNA